MAAAGYLLNNRTYYNPDLGEEVIEILNDFEKPYRFHKSLDEYCPTPLIEIPHLSELLGINKILIKDEGQRFGTSALKILGASYAVYQEINHSKSIKGICTATDGNHGRAVAWACKKNGLESVVFVPYQTSVSRIRFIEEEGAKVIVSKGHYDQAVKEAAAYAEENNITLLQDTSWTNYHRIPSTITSGYYTEMHEVSEQTNKLMKPAIDVVFIQAGVGSWPSAIVHFIRKYLNNQKVKIVCVEPYESDAIYESVKRASLATTRKSQKTIMAGLNCGTPSYIAFEILKQGVDAFLTISDEYAIDAIKYLNAPLPGDPYVAAGESGSAGLAALLAIIRNKNIGMLKKQLGITKESNILVFNTENVTDPDLHYQLLSDK
ncbi:MAG: diaminopropionate ammonia-lyase [Bacteroidales bacterium]|nr:diaminopropionate ammonia-lyase [Bacteroidales bacterium]MBN2819822.1 diaminopropionate ammonia-lyase [Bacteroidales bacterium]